MQSKSFFGHGLFGWSFCSHQKVKCHWLDLPVLIDILFVVSRDVSIIPRCLICYTITSISPEKKTLHVRSFFLFCHKQWSEEIAPTTVLWWVDGQSECIDITPTWGGMIGLVRLVAPQPEHHPRVLNSLTAICLLVGMKKLWLILFGRYICMAGTQNECISGFYIRRNHLWPLHWTH